MKLMICSLMLWLSHLTTAQASEALYEQLGGQQGIDNICRNFIHRVGETPSIRRYFEASDLNRFHREFANHLCQLAGGGCVYGGDSMEQVHTGMNVTEKDFNRVVELFIAAMEQEKVPQPAQNQILHRMAALYSSVVYR